MIHTRILILFATFVTLTLHAESLEKDGYFRFECGEVVQNSFTSPRTMVTLPDGGFVVAATHQKPNDNNQYLCVAKFLANGKPNPDFNKGASALYLLPGSFPQFENMVSLPSGKILITATFFVGEDLDFGLVQLLPDGTLDPSFGKKGIVSTDMAFGTNDFIMGSAVGPDGKILVSGLVNADDKTGFGLARYLPSGELDPDFAEGGRYIQFFDTNVAFGGSLALLPDGSFYPYIAEESPEGQKAYLLHFDRTGKMQMTFGKGGRVEVKGPLKVHFPSSMQVTSEGKIMVAVGSANENEFIRSLRLLNPDGTFDMTFGKEGLLSLKGLPINSDRFFTVLPGNKVLMAHEFTESNKYGLRILRALPTGEFDPTFGKDGVTKLMIEGQYFFGLANPAVGTDGKILLTGANYFSQAYHGFIARFTAEGKLDVPPPPQ